MNITHASAGSLQNCTVAIERRDISGHNQSTCNG
ncbi:hypothetical protein J2X32_002888 [Rheinheimera pacifica]|nr:hypothetical protein [Rheinheimera pacifica]